MGEVLPEGCDWHLNDAIRPTAEQIEPWQQAPSRVLWNRSISGWVGFDSDNQPVWSYNMYRNFWEWVGKGEGAEPYTGAFPVEFQPKIRHEYTYTEPASGVQVTFQVGVLKDYPISDFSFSEDMVTLMGRSYLYASYMWYNDFSISFEDYLNLVKEGKGRYLMVGFDPQDSDRHQLRWADPTHFSRFLTFDDLPYYRGGSLTHYQGINDVGTMISGLQIDRLFFESRYEALKETYGNVIDWQRGFEATMSDSFATSVIIPIDNSCFWAGFCPNPRDTGIYYEIVHTDIDFINLNKEQNHVETNMVSVEGLGQLP